MNRAEVSSVVKHLQSLYDVDEATLSRGVEIFVESLFRIAREMR